MTRDSRLSGVLHVLMHLAQAGDPVTSEVLAKALDTNAVVIRRTLAGLRDAGYVRSEKGHGGGWTLACDLASVTLHDVYVALGSPPLIALGHRPNTGETTHGCLVEQAVQAALDASFHEAEALLLARLGEVTLAALGKDVRRRVKARRRHDRHDSHDRHDRLDHRAEHLPA